MPILGYVLLCGLCFVVYVCFGTPLLGWKRIAGYSTRFTEVESAPLAASGYMRHPWNSVSSFSFVVLGAWLILTGNDPEGGDSSLRLYEITMGVMNIVFGLSSFLYHATESETVGTVDIALVFANKIGVLLVQFNLSFGDAALALNAILVLMAGDFFRNWETPEDFSVLKYEYKLLAVCLVLIFATFHGDYEPYFVFLAAYVFKLCDFLATRKFRRRWTGPLQGTSVYHILTAVSIYMKIQDAAKKI